jgi:glycosyltransferase involved in cell wall biosynthesis
MSLYDACRMAPRKFRILLVNSFFVPRTTGSAHFTEGVARRYAAAGHDVVVLTTSYEGSPDEEHHSGYRVVRMPFRPIAPRTIAFNYSLPFTIRPATIRRTRRLFDEFRPDVVHQNGQFFDLTWLTSVLASRRGIPRVLTVHTALTHDRPAYRKLIRLADRLVVRPLNAIGHPTMVVIDKFIDQYIRSVYRDDEYERCFIPVGVDPIAFADGDGDVVRARHGLGDRPIILSLGHVIPLRNRVAIVRALPRIRVRFPDVALLVVGEVYDTTFLKVAEEVGVRDHVFVAGRVERHAVPDYIAAATIEGHDHQRFGLGTATLEVMSSGVPVFTVIDGDNYPGIDLGAWPELCLLPDDHPNTMSNAVCDLLEDAEVRTRVGIQQQKFVHDLLSIDAVASRYLEQFDRLVSGGAGSA